MAWNSIDRSFKTLINRVTTNATKAFYEEIGADTINTAMREIWIDPFSSTPAVAVTEGKAQLYTLYVLTEDTSVPLQQAYNTNGLTDWISPKFGANYEIKLYDNTNTQIPPTNASQWFFDYQTGILTFNASTGAFPKPFKITGYRYIGNKGRVVRDLGFNSTSGLQVNYTNGTIEYLPVTGGVSGPLSGLKAEYVFASLQTGIPSVINYSVFGFSNIANIQFYEVVSSGTSGTAGGGDDTLQQCLLDIKIDQLTSTIIISPDVTVEGFLHIIGDGDLLLVSNVPNATTTIKGVVEIADQNEFNNGIDVGTTGAILSIRPSMIKAAIQDVDYLILPPPITPYDNYGLPGNWSYDQQFMYFCLPAGTSGTSGTSGNLWRRIAVDVW
jgi:hypothetical protein